MEEKKTKRGFANMTPEQIREMASKGGKAAHAQGKAPEFNSETAKAAGRLGGLATQRKKAAAQRPAAE